MHGALAQMSLVGSGDRPAWQNLVDPFQVVFPAWPERRVRVRIHRENRDIEGIIYRVDFLGAIAMLKIKFEDGRTFFFFPYLFSTCFSETLMVPEDRDVGVSRPEYSNINNVHELLKLLVDQGDRAPPILVRAKAGTGKTWSSRQLIRTLAKHASSKNSAPEARGGYEVLDVSLVDDKERAAGRADAARDPDVLPLLVYIQQLSREFRRSWSSANRSEATTLSVLESTFREHMRNRGGEMLLKAFDQREVLVVLDGVDEAADLSRVIEQFILEKLVDEGHRVMVTSRYEGVRLDLFEDFVVLDLRPLGVQQQQDVIQAQLGGNEYFEHLLEFSAIRRKHDVKYENEAFPLEEHRDELEASEPVDRLKLKTGGFDEQMVTKMSANQPLALQHGDPVSATLSKADREVFHGKVLEAMDAVHETTAGATSHQLEAAVRAALDVKKPAVANSLVNNPLLQPQANRAEAKLRPWDDLSSDEKLLIGRLALLSQKRRTLPSSLWRDIVMNTDQLYVVCEKLEQVFRDGVCELALMINMPAERIQFAPRLKDPIRAYEKAFDDYQGRFGDHVLPVACVMDILRCRIVCTNAQRFCECQAGLGGLDFSSGGERARIELVREKNKFRALDPTHFRNILNNVLVSQGGVSTLAEIQLHHDIILTHNESSGAHEHYDYFRTKMAGSYGTRLAKELDFILNTTIKVFEDVVKVPVKLSLLAVVLGDQANTSQLKLPRTVYELYQMAIDIVIRKRHDATGSPESSIRRMLRLIAYSNMRARRRVFTSADVAATLHYEPELMALWKMLSHDEKPPPLVKVLTAPSEADEGGEWQFGHLSFQEFLYVEVFKLCGHDELPPGFQWGAADKVAWLKDKFNDNTIQIGCDVFAQKLFQPKYGSDLDFRGEFAFPEQTLRLCRIIGGGKTGLESLSLSGPFDEEGLKLLGSGCANAKRTADALEKEAPSAAPTRLTRLDLGGSGIDGSMMKTLASAGLLDSDIQVLGLKDNELDAGGVSQIVAALRQDGSRLTEIDLRENRISGRVDLGLFSFIAPIPVIITLCWWLVYPEHWYYWLVMAGFLLIPSGKVSTTFVPESFEARERLRSHAKPSVFVRLWFPIETREIWQVLLSLLPTIFVWAINWLFKVIVYGSMSMVCRCRKTREQKKAGPLLGVGSREARSRAQLECASETISRSESFAP